MTGLEFKCDVIRGRMVFLGPTVLFLQSGIGLYQFQVKDQSGSFFYFQSLNFQRASGGFGPFILNNREIIPIPFAQPDGDIILLIGDWYTQNHTVSIEMDLVFSCE